MLSLIVRYIKKCYKRSIVIGICFFMSFLIIWTNGILKHTGNLVELNFLKEDSIYHLKFHNLNEKALASIKKSPDVDKIHIENLVDASKTSSKYMINVIGKDKSQYKVLRGRYPNNHNEVMVQDWLLKNIGKDIGDNFEFESYISKGKVSYKIVGVLEDNVKEKSKLMFQFFTLNRKNQLDKYNLVNIILKDKGNIRSASKKIIKDLKDKNLVKEGDYSINDMLIEAYENDGSTGLEVFKIIFMSVLFTSVIIASTYLISVRTRLEDMGIFKAIGMGFFDIFKLIIGELYLLMFVGGLAAFPSSIMLSNYIIARGENFYSEVQANMVSYSGLVIEPKIILIGLISVMASVLVIGLVVYWLAVKGSPIDMIRSRNRMKISYRSSRFWNYICDKFDVGIFIFLKYLRADYILTLVVILSVSLPISEILMRSYYSRENEKVMEMTDDFTKADFTIRKNNILDLTSYIPKSTADEIGDIKMPDGKSCIDRNMWANFKFSYFDIEKSMMNRKDYFDEKNKSPYMSKVLDGLYKENGKGYTIKNIVLGYNDQALEALKDHIYEGKKTSIDKNNISKDECILYYPVNYIDINRGKDPRNKILNYKLGDRIEVNIANKLKNTSLSDKEIGDFWQLKGRTPTIKKSYKIVAIVDYLPVTSGSGQDSSVNVIIPHEHMVDIDKDMGYSVGEIYIRDIKDQSFIEKSMIEKLKEYPEYFLSNMSKERLENSMAEVSYLSTENIKYYSFILVAVACMINLLTYKLMSKKKDIGLMMSLGMTESDIRTMLIGEALVYAVFSTILSLTISMVRQFVYIREMESVSRIIGLSMDINPIVFLSIFAVSLGVCMSSIYLPAKKILASDIREAIGDLE